MNQKSKSFFFTSGLPRAGSTLLAAVLNQNPRFQASISGPLARFVRAIIEQSSAQGGYRYQCDESKRKKLIQNLVDTYHDNPEKEVFFDHNRGWNLLLPVLKECFPETKVIVCVRDLPWILDSFERLVRANCLSVTSMFSPEENVNVYTRSAALVREDRTIGFAFQALKQALCSDERPMLFLLEYETLCKHPAETMRALYKFLGQPFFKHDFDNVESSYDEFDQDVGLKNMHTTRKKLEFIPRKSIIPPDIIEQFQNYSIWK